MWFNRHSAPVSRSGTRRWSARLSALALGVLLLAVHSTEAADSIAGMPMPNLGQPPPQAPPPVSSQPPAPVAAPPAVAAPAQQDLLTVQARAELHRAQVRSGLSEAQAAQLAQGQAALESGDAAAALTQLRALNRELVHDRRSYVVQGSENLAQIAAREEIYNNELLWPLLWRANADQLKAPERVQKGMRLNVLPHPTIDEINDALAFARQNPLPAENDGGAAH